MTFTMYLGEVDIMVQSTKVDSFAYMSFFVREFKRLDSFVTLSSTGLERQNVRTEVPQVVVVVEELSYSPEGDSRGKSLDGRVSDAGISVSKIYSILPFLWYFLRAFGSSQQNFTLTGTFLHSPLLLLLVCHEKIDEPSHRQLTTSEIKEYAKSICTIGQDTANVRL